MNALYERIGFSIFFRGCNHSNLSTIFGCEIIYFSDRFFKMQIAEKIFLRKNDSACFERSLPQKGFLNVIFRTFAG